MVENRIVRVVRHNAVQHNFYTLQDRGSNYYYAVGNELFVFFFFSERDRRTECRWQEIRGLHPLDVAAWSHGIFDHGHLSNGKPTAGDGEDRRRVRKLNTRAKRFRPSLYRDVSCILILFSTFGVRFYYTYTHAHIYIYMCVCVMRRYRYTCIPHTTRDRSIVLALYYIYMK